MEQICTKAYISSSDALSGIIKDLSIINLFTWCKRVVCSPEHVSTEVKLMI